MEISCQYISFTKARLNAINQHIRFHVHSMSHKQNHWANENTSFDLIKELLVPYVRKVRQKLSLPEDRQWLLIADVFKGHWTNAVITEVKRSNCKMCATPNNMTNIFQLLDLSINRSCKSFLCREAQCWYSLQIEKQMKEGKKAHEINVNTRINIMKPFHAKWVVHSMIIWKIIVTSSWLDGENLKLKKFSVANRTLKVIPLCK